MNTEKGKGPQPKGRKEQNQVVNEQDQQERVNPGGDDFQSASGKKQSADQSFNQENQPGLMENKPGLEEGNTYEDDPREEE